MGENFDLGPEISQLSARQHGNISRGQLLTLGLNDNAIHHRVRRGLLHPVYRGVYAVGRPAKYPLERAAAAVLACGPGAVLSHESALALWGLAKHWTFPLQVTIRTGDRRPKGITVHRNLTLARKDIRPEQAIWATTPARTILDCAPTLNRKQLTRLVNQARRAGHVTPEALSEIAQRYPRHRGTKRLRALDLPAGGPTDSGFEDDFIAFCRHHGLPTPLTNIHLHGFKLDTYFPDHRVIVELDSWEYHQSREAFERDRERDRITTAAGLITVRLTGLTDREADQLRRVLASRLGG